MTKFLAPRSAAAIILAIATATSAMADEAMVGKAPPMAAAPVATGPATCGSVADFFLGSCVLSR
jgi:hypothetical protein